MAQVSISDNGPFDPRVTSIPFTQSLGGQKKLTRGFIIQEKAHGGVRHKCSFLYNPSILYLSHSVNGNVVADDNAINPNDVSGKHLLMPLQQTLSFTLRFDRTYELWDPSKMHGSTFDWVSRFGVAYDILSLYKITGIATPMKSTGDEEGDTGSSLEAFSKGQFSNGPAGPMLTVPVYAVLGTSLSFYGVIQSMDVRYIHWTQDMIPARAEVDVSIQLLPAPSVGNSNSSPLKRAGDDSTVAPAFPGAVESRVAPAFGNSGKGGR